MTHRVGELVAYTGTTTSRTINTSHIKNNTMQLTKQEIKLIKKALLNQRVGKGEEKTKADIYKKLEKQEANKLKNNQPSTQ